MNENYEPYNTTNAAGEQRNPQSQMQYTTAPYVTRGPVKKKRSARFIAGIIALCFVCAVIGGAAGVGVSGIVFGSGSTPTAQAAPGGTAASPLVLSPADSTPPVSSAASGVTGAVLTGDQIYALGCPSTVGVTTEVTTTNYFGQTTSGAVTGTGFIISADGYILTNHHVIEAAATYDYDVSVVLHDGAKYPAKIVGYEDENDVAVLKIEATGLTPVTLGNSDSMSVGETVYAIGNPLGELTYTMTSGIVSALDREISTDESTTINMFQIDAAVNSGNSGGPVFNSRGEVIGIVTAKYSSSGVEGLGFSIPINDAINIANDLLKYGYVTGKPYFGITVTTVSESAAKYYNMVVGAYVYQLDESSCAATAGLQVGDIITKIGDTDIISSSELVIAKKQYAAGDTVSLLVYRNGEYLNLSITFDEEGAPKAAGDNLPTSEATPSPGATVEPVPTPAPSFDPFSGWPFSSR